LRDRDKRKGFFLDYDGTLREFEDYPDKAVPTPRLRKIFDALRDRGDIASHILSGRRGEFMDQHLDGYGFTLIAEHGYMVRSCDGDWEHLVPDVNDQWMEMILPVFEMYASSTPGCFVEKKHSSIVWHYRKADPEFGTWKASELLSHLSEVVSNLPVNVVHGNKIVEVNSQQINKGAAMERFIMKERFDLVICAGDDRTDEDMFRIPGDSIVRIKVGSGISEADYRVASPSKLMDLLEQWLEIYPEWNERTL
jgi:trehalose 6-phosphate synthase/phosphatase